MEKRRLSIIAQAGVKCPSGLPEKACRGRGAGEQLFQNITLTLIFDLTLTFNLLLANHLRKLVEAEELASSYFKFIFTHLPFSFYQKPSHSPFIFLNTTLIFQLTIGINLVFPDTGANLAETEPFTFHINGKKTNPFRKSNLS